MLRDDEPIDRLDSEDVASMLDSRGWALFLERLSAVLRDKTMALRNVQPEGLQRLQGEIAGIERVLAIPEEIMSIGKARR